MKVGVLTFHRVSNYGTALQAYATVAALKELGFDAELMDYRPEYIERTVRVRRLRRARSVKEAASILVNRLIYGKQQAQKIERFLEFVAPIPRGELVAADSLARAARQYDIIISGSDQLWNENVTGPDLSYFLPFDHPRKISFASSFGVSGLTEGRKETISPYLKDFSAISLREQTALEMVSEMLGAQKPPLHRVVDPTLLLDAQCWKQQATQLDLPPEGYILTYYMIETPAMRAVTEKLRQETGLPIVNLKPSKRQMLRREGQNMMWAGPREFLSCYAGARYVVTNSFHGTAFAINFGIPMYVCPLPVSMAGEVNSRLVEILEWYGLSDRWIDSADQSFSVSPLPEALPRIRQQRREESIQILKSMLAP